MTEHAEVEVGHGLARLQDAAEHLGQVVGRDTRAQQAVKAE